MKKEILIAVSLFASVAFADMKDMNESKEMDHSKMDHSKMTMDHSKSDMKDTSIMKDKVIIKTNDHSGDHMHDGVMSNHSK